MGNCASGESIPYYKPARRQVSVNVHSQEYIGHVNMYQARSLDHEKARYDRQRPEPIPLPIQAAGS